MKFISSFLLIFFTLGPLQAQDVERKVIIENGTFYYTTVDENLQLATLYTGDSKTPLKLAKAFAVPAGRGISAETNPFVWDIAGDVLMAINFLDHSLNDRNEALKKIPLSNLKQWGPTVSVEEVMMESIDKHYYQLNEPYLFVKNRSKYLNHFYFDAIMHEGNYWVAKANNDELTLWKFVDDTWIHSAVIDFPITNYFSLVSHDGTLFLITQEGIQYKANLQGLTEVNRFELNLSTHILIEDRDANKIYAFSPSSFNLEKNMAELIATFGHEIGLKN